MEKDFIIQDEYTEMDFFKKRYCVGFMANFEGEEWSIIEVGEATKFRVHGLQAKVRAKKHE